MSKCAILLKQSVCVIDYHIHGWLNLLCYVSLRPRSRCLNRNTHIRYVICHKPNRFLFNSLHVNIFESHAPAVCFILCCSHLQYIPLSLFQFQSISFLTNILVIFSGAYIEKSLTLFPPTSLQPVLPIQYWAFSVFITKILILHCRSLSLKRTKPTRLI